MMGRHPRAVLAVLLTINVLAYVDRSMLYGFAPQMTKDLGLDNTQFGLLSGAVWVLSYGVMVLVFGTLADRYSRTRIIAAGMLVWCLCTAASGLAQDFSQMVMARFLVAAGEAALGPSATALLAELFDARQRSTANGLFFMGIPLGIGLSYLLSGAVSPEIGWRGTFLALGFGGAAIAVAVGFVRDERTTSVVAQALPMLPQLRALVGALAVQPAAFAVIAGFVVVHLVFVEVSFLQLWLVRERGADAATMAQRVGMLQILFGCIGAAGGGLAADRIARGVRSRLALFPALSIAVCVPLMIACRLAAPDSAMLYIGLSAGFFLPFSIYGSSLALIQASVSPRMIASVIGFTMMSINIFAVALGTFVFGLASDRLAAAGHSAPLTTVLLVTDALVALALLLYAKASRAFARDQAALPSAGDGAYGQ